MISLADLDELDTEKLAFFRFREVGGHALVTNQEGRFLLLPPEEFRTMATGSWEEGSALEKKLRENNFLADHYDVRRAGQEYQARKHFLNHGPNLHLMVVTLRCNETCVYCHASRANMDAVHTDMTPETAEKAVDLALKTTSPFVTIEFQGGEPLVAFDVVEHTIEYALEQNAKIGKDLEFTMVSNLSLLDDDKLDYLVKRRVQICTSIDGPQDLHDSQRKLPQASAYGQAKDWIARINQRYVDMGLDPTLYHVEALVTTTKAALGRGREIVDTYLELGCRALFLRPVDPFGFAARSKTRIEYPRQEYLDTYRDVLDYILELNSRGERILERYAAIFLTKILGGVDPNFLDVRWPAGAGIGQLAYNYDGRIFTCDEGRMLHEMGDSTFEIGHVETSKYRELVSHPTVRAVSLASNLEQNPDCEGCTYQPYCGIPPVHSYKTQGDIFGRMRESTLCQVHKGIQDILFEKIAQADPQTVETFRRWTTHRPRHHFVQ